MDTHEHPIRTVLLGTKRLRKVPFGTIQHKSADPRLRMDVTDTGSIYDAFPIKLDGMIYKITYTTREPIIASLRILPWFLLAHIPHRIRVKTLEVTKDQYNHPLKNVPLAQREATAWS